MAWDQSSGSKVARSDADGDAGGREQRQREVRPRCPGSLQQLVDKQREEVELAAERNYALTADPRSSQMLMCLHIVNPWASCLAMRISYHQGAVLADNDSSLHGLRSTSSRPGPWAWPFPRAGLGPGSSALSRCSCARNGRACSSSSRTGW